MSREALTGDQTDTAREGFAMSSSKDMEIDDPSSTKPRVGEHLGKTGLGASGSNLDGNAHDAN